VIGNVRLVVEKARRNARSGVLSAVSTEE